MGRTASYPRTINGQDCSSENWKRAITEFIRTTGEGGSSHDEIMRGLEIPKEQGGTLRRTLEWLAALGTPKHPRTPHITRIAWGRYKTVDAVTHGFSPGERLRQHMVIACRDNGGFIRDRDMLEVFDLRPTKEANERAGRDLRSTPDYALIIRYLHEPPFWRVGPGLSCISDIDGRIILEGRWVKDTLTIEGGARDRFGPASDRYFASEEAVMEAIHDHFSQVGYITDDLLKARGWNEGDDILQNPQITPALDLWLARAETFPEPKTFNRNISKEFHWSKDWVNNSGAVKNARNYVEQKYPETMPAADDRLALLRAFRDGFRYAHETCPRAFYLAFAASMGIDPVYYSRGIIRGQIARCADGFTKQGETDYETILQEALASAMPVVAEEKVLAPVE